MTNEQQQQQTHQNHQQRLARRRTSSTASLELNLLQDDEDGLEFELEASAIHNDNNTNNLSSEKDRQEQQVQQQQQQQQQQSSTSTRRDHVHYLSTLFAGVGSGALSSFICAPLDLIRTRMQVWGEIQDKQGNKKKITPGEAFRAIIKKEGPKGIFRGLGATLLTVPLFWGVYFPLYDETKHYLQTQNENTSKVLINYHPGVVHCISAIFTGAVADLICNPLFVVRTRLQTQALHELNSSTSTTATRPTSMIQMANELRTKHGVTVFWRGMTANIMGLSHCAVQFPAYEFLKSYLREQRHNNNIINNSNNSGNINLISSDSDNNMINDNTVGELLIASGMAKMTASLLTYPHEVLRSRMMDDRSSTAPTLRGTAKHIYMKEGIKGYYNGLSVTLLRVVPNCCVTFLSYELILKYSKDYFGNNKI